MLVRLAPESDSHPKEDYNPIQTAYYNRMFISCQNNCRPAPTGRSLTTRLLPCSTSNVAMTLRRTTALTIQTKAFQNSRDAVDEAQKSVLATLASTRGRGKAGLDEAQRSRLEECFAILEARR
jgi:hypothetical protein